MKKAARELLRDMGSDKVSSLGWRDMWAMVAIKGGMPRSNFALYCIEVSYTVEVFSTSSPLSADQILRICLWLAGNYNDYCVFYLEHFVTVSYPELGYGTILNL